MGRPTKLTRTVKEKVCRAIRCGAHHRLAADYARIGLSTMQLWLSLGREERERLLDGGQPHPEKKPYLDFLGAVEDAEASAGIDWLMVIDEAANQRKDPEWAMRMLRLRFPEGFREEQRVELDIGGTLAKILEGLASQGGPTDDRSGAV